MPPPPPSEDKMAARSRQWECRVRHQANCPSQSRFFMNSFVKDNVHYSAALSSQIGDWKLQMAKILADLVEKIVSGLRHVQPIRRLNYKWCCLGVPLAYDLRNVRVVVNTNTRWRWIRNFKISWWHWSLIDDIDRQYLTLKVHLTNVMVVTGDLIFCFHLIDSGIHIFLFMLIK